MGPSWGSDISENPSTTSSNRLSTLAITNSTIFTRRSSRSRGQDGYQRHHNAHKPCHAHLNTYISHPSITMPPPTHPAWRAIAFRPAIPTRTSARTAASSSRATTAATTPRPRLFHTTRALASLHDEVPTPPESPNFFSLPALPQSDDTKKPFIKGHLPVPRALFSKRAAGPHKISGRFVRDTAPLSAAERAGLPPKSEKDAWKRVMAASRRAALSQGISNLWRRKKRRDHAKRSRAVSHQRANAAASAAPPPADEVHTRSTVTQATLTTVVVRDPLYAERQRASLARTKAIHAAQSERRKDAVQRLYVEASYFILTEKDLADRIEFLFRPGYFKKGSMPMAQFGATNVWQAHGPPKSIRGFVADIEVHGNDVVKSLTSSGHKTTIRQRALTGELTGGALSVLKPEFFEPKSLQVESK